MPAISVIVPVYKVEAYLHRCVESILGQTYQDFELILVDDGSPDNCGAICEEYARRDARVVVIHQENGGLSAARNAGIDWAFANSDSQWLFFVDSDDFIHPESLERLLAAALELNVDISIGGYAETSGDPPVVNAEDLTPKLWKSRDFYIQKNVNAIVAWGKIYRKELFRQIRYPVGKIHEDEYTTYKLLFACENIAVIPAELYGYYYNPDGITKKGWYPKRMDLLDAYRERITFFEKMMDRNLAEMTVEAYVWSIKYHLGQAKDYPSICRALRRRIGCIMLRYRWKYPLKKYLWLYSIAFPRLTALVQFIITRRNRS